MLILLIKFKKYVMKAAFLVATILSCNLIKAALVQDIGLDNREIRKNKLGSIEVIDWHEKGSKKEIFLPTKHIHTDYERVADFLK